MTKNIYWRGLSQSSLARFKEAMSNVGKDWDKTPGGDVSSRSRERKVNVAVVTSMFDIHFSNPRQACLPIPSVCESATWLAEVSLSCNVADDE